MKRNLEYSIRPIMNKKDNSVNYRLGLDLGTNSIGWAMLCLDDENNPNKVLKAGVRIFSDGRRAGKSSISNAVTRRQARGARRRRDRYLRRRAKLMNRLIKFGLMPPNKSDRKKLEQEDPYKLRAQAITEQLSSYELGRVLFHLNQRRGFKSNRKENTTETKSDLKEGIKRLEAHLKENQTTLGAFLYAKNTKKGNKTKGIRFKPHLLKDEDYGYPSRAMYADEFDAIRKKQADCHQLTPEQWDDLREIIFHQRPLKPGVVGKCQYEPDEKRAAKALPIIQRFRIVQEVANIRIHMDTGETISLSQQQRKDTVDFLLVKKNVEFSSKTLLKKLQLGSNVAINLETEVRKTLKGDVTGVLLSGTKDNEVFGKSWFKKTIEEQNTIVELLLDEHDDLDDDGLVRKAQEEWGLTLEQAEIMVSLSLPQGYGHVSQKAALKLTAYMEEHHCDLTEAVKEKYPDFYSNDDIMCHDTLGYYGKVVPRSTTGGVDDPKPEDDDSKRYGKISNPTVHIGLGQLRRVVNALIAQHGKPSQVVIELARDLKWNQEQKSNYEKKQKINTKNNEKYNEQIQASGKNPSYHWRNKLRLYAELEPLKHCCPYCDKTISQAMVLSEETDVDHILPVSKSLDESMANKILCHSKCNREKGNKTPHEAFGWLAKSANLPANKQWRFKKEDVINAKLELDPKLGFAARQLNDTSYFSRVSADYLKTIIKDPLKNVWVTPGQLTGRLRRQWGFNELLNEQANEKDRTDHRHHALDAIVIALTDRRTLQRYSRASATTKKIHHDGTPKITLDAPWDDFRDQIKPVMNAIVVSHRPERVRPGKHSRIKQDTTSGQLHNETAYGMAEKIKEDGSNVDYTKPVMVVSTKPVGKNIIESTRQTIRDPKLKDAMKRHWESVEAQKEPSTQDGSGKKESKEKTFVDSIAKPHALEKYGFKGARSGVRSVRIAEELTVIEGSKNKEGKVEQWFKPHGNAFMDIYKLPDNRDKKKHKKEYASVIVTIRDANRKDFLKYYNQLKPHPAAKKIMRLYINDYILLNGSDLYRVQKDVWEFNLVIRALMKPTPMPVIMRLERIRIHQE